MSAAASLDGIAAWAVDLMDTLGAPGAGLVVALESVVPPIPSEVVLPLAGLTASRGGFGLVEAIAWTTAGSVLGALVLYGLGRLVGRERVRAFLARVPLIRMGDVDTGEAWFARHGPAAVFFGRMLPLVRSVISLPAGVERMPVLRFVAYTAAGSAIWNSAFVVAGYELGENWRLVERYASVLQYAVAAVLLVALAVLLRRRVRQLRARPARRAR